jgi:hypothetical protein
VPKLVFAYCSTVLPYIYIIHTGMHACSFFLFTMYICFSCFLQPKYESKTLREIIDPYTSHLSDTSQPSCLSLILGMYSISIKGKMTYLIACKNVFPRDLAHVVEMYDVKGSTIGRKAASTSKVAHFNLYNLSKSYPTLLSFCFFLFFPYECTCM